jgi:hypothetical protein
LILPVFASNVFSADWGCRIVGINSPGYNPNGYHTGSVWPLFTGWTSLAEFKYGNYLQGFSHLMNNLLIYRHWGAGLLEEVLNGEKYNPSGVCHHQCWSQTMVLQPAIEGMIGFQPDALKNQITLKPWLPANWDSVSIQNMRIGNQFVSMQIIRQNNRTIFHFNSKGDTTLDVKFSPVFPPGTILESVRINGQPAREPTFDLIQGGWITARFGFWLREKSEVIIKHHGGITLLPLVPRPGPGDTSNGFRVLKADFKDNTYTILFQGRRASKETFNVWIADGLEPSVENAILAGKNGNIFQLEIEFMDVETDFTSKLVSISF